MDDAFKVKRGGKKFDYRVGQHSPLNDIKKYFEETYKVKKLWQGKRHVLGIVPIKGEEAFLKLSTTHGISIRTETERIWNDQVNRYSQDPNFLIPKNISFGYYKNKLFYMITEYFQGPLIADIELKRSNIEKNIDKIIKVSEIIQNLPLEIPVNDAIEAKDFRKWFMLKTKSWLGAIPEKIKITYEEIESLWREVLSGSSSLEKRVRHGDFTPWHMIELDKGKLGLIDGEHAHSYGVEYYDICYFIQRVFCVLNNPNLAKLIFSALLKRNCHKEKLRTVLAARGIGGFLDQSFKERPDYKYEKMFSEWVLYL